MIPIKNRKKNLEATVEEMRNFAFVYIEKYAPSKQQLRTYLLKKYLKTSIPNINKKSLTTCGKMGSICAGHIVTQLGPRTSISLENLIKKYL